MTAIDEAVVVNITKESAKLTRAGFGTPMILGVHAAFAERIRTYSNITAVAQDFATTDEEYRIAALLFGQEVGPQKIKIGRREVSAAQDQQITISVVADDTEYFVIVNGQKISFTSGSGATANSIVDGLEAAFASFVGDVTFTDNADGTYNLTSDIAAKGFSVETDAGQTIGANTNTNAIGDEIQAVLDVDSDWYFLLTTSIGNQTDRDTDNAAAAATIEALTKQFHYSDGNADALSGGTSNIFYTLQNLSRERSYGKWAAEWYDYPEASLVGLQAPKDPGSTNWKFQEISGAAGQVFTDTQRTNLKGLNANFNEVVGGVNLEYSEAVMASGDYVDEIRGIDWLETRIAEDVFALLVASEKVPFTNPGINSVVKTVRARLLIGETNGLLVPGSSTVTAPDISEVNAVDKANRLLKTVEFTSTLQGAVNKVEITGKVTV